MQVLTLSGGDVFVSLVIFAYVCGAWVVGLIRDLRGDY